MAILIATLVTSGCGFSRSQQSLNTVVEYPPGQRGAAVTLAGATLKGPPVTTEKYLGHVVVVNLWGSWCPPCLHETPLLAQAARALKNVDFLGIDVRDFGKASPIALVEQDHVPYPSIYDPSSSLLLRFGPKSPRLTPSTVVLDKTGRVAAVISGEVSSVTTLKEVISDAS